MSQGTTQFGRQPAHFLIVDLSKPMNHDALLNIFQSLGDFFSLVSQISGPSQVPLFGLNTIGQFAEVCLTVGHWILESISQGLKDVLTQYERQQQTFRQITNLPCQLEITIVTCQHSDIISAHVRKVSRTLNLDCLKKVQVVRVKSQEALQNEMNSPSSVECCSDDSMEAISDIVDVLSIENDALCMMNFFKVWLKDCSSDTESLHIVLPTLTSSSSGIYTGLVISNNNSYIMVDDSSSGCEMVLKCDLHEVLIDPLALLNCGEYFNLKGDYTFPKSYSQTNRPGGASQFTKKVSRLRALSLVRTNGVCESVVTSCTQLYGLPMYARPTCCWKLDWDELESNQQNFNSLCNLLSEKELSLILKSEFGHQEKEQSLPQSYFMVMASSNSASMIIKSVAMEELMLPMDFPSLSQKTSQQSVEFIEESLHKLPLLDVYNPFFMKSNLFKFIVSKTIKNSSSSRGNKRKFQAPQKMQNTQNRSFSSNNSCRGGKQTATGRKKVSFQSPDTHRYPTAASSRSVQTPKRSRMLSKVSVIGGNTS
ncbi:meiosis 1 arrest protein-like [Xenia sp. Carnegie-2017]|uniref:meiosis 1 arrest protein-like n=1 Tax=Xenia sp. Carnegie-2017 TaxID=2897299 RepID=UPI001F0467C8|nr:meiosis 1 arrest protein-like [Xenia sp. Carnegie-2017]